ncbi:MAG TPA: DUF1918 domain-containing protein [Acidimicrobiia bacterium]|nr:DUF1918 domain-containing protein [Acidimicrobiia bacterium]
MQASVGDRLAIKAHHVGEHDRDAEIVDVRGPGGDPPWVIRWEDSGHEVLFFPGPDAMIEHYPPHGDGERPLRRPRARSIVRAAS